MKTQKAVVAVCIAAVLLTCVFVCSDHNCCGEGCALCALNEISRFAIAFTLSAFAFCIAHMCASEMRTSYYTAENGTLINEKVRLND